MAEPTTTAISLPTNHASVNTVYMEHIPLATAGSTSWYEYNSFNNLLVTPAVPTPILALPQQTQEIILQPAGSVTSKTKSSKTKQRPSIHERMYCCEDCGAAFTNSSNLKSHVRIHSGERPYVCSDCGVSFTQSSNLKAHKRIHTGERPYTCMECGQTFSRSSHLIGHKRTHTGERPYICGVCQDSFVTSTHLRNHMRKHTGERPFTCHICEAAFAQNSSLQIHMRIHTGERPFKCIDCTAAFRSKGDLRSHRKLHTDERPFNCDRCTKTFKTNQYLQKHLKKCGAPPSGKKRGRPRKSTSFEALSSVSPERKKRSPGKSKGRRGRPPKPLPFGTYKVTKPVNFGVEGEIINEEILEEEFDEEELATTLASMSEMEEIDHEDMKSLGHNLSELEPLEQQHIAESSVDPESSAIQLGVPHHVELKHDVKHVIQLSDLQQLQIHEAIQDQHAKQHIYEVTLQPQETLHQHQTIQASQLGQITNHTQQPQVITIQIQSQNPQPSQQSHLQTTSQMHAQSSQQVLDQITQSLPELKNPDDTFGEIDTNGLDQMDPTSDPLHITSVEHIEHMPVEHIERVVHVVQY
ncbi:unnamed protein product, partial [Meganyctiphanes norvegica]